MTGRKYWLVVASLLLGTGLLYSVFLLPYVRTFHIKDEDFPLIFNSARQYHPNPALWVTRGYSSYFDPFPDLPHLNTHFCRPVVNATFWLESLLSPGTGPLNLTTNFLGLVITLILFMFFLRRETSGNILFLSSMLIVYAFSATWYEAVLLSAYRGSLLMVLFALAAFLLLPPEGSRHRGLRITLSILCQLGSLLSHEAGVVTPVIAALLFVFRRDGKVARARLKVLPLFLLPLLCFAALRWVFYGGVGHTYAVEPEHGWASMGIVNGLRLLAKPFFPWETDVVVFGERSLRVVIGALMNLAGCALVAWALLRPGKAGRRPLLRALLCLGVALAVLWVGPKPRLMQLAAVFGALAAIVAVEQIGQGAGQRWVRRGLAAGLVGLAVGQLLIYLTSFPRMVAGGLAQNWVARVEFEGLRRVIATMSTPTLLLVDDQGGRNGSNAMLDMAAWGNRGRVSRLITVDSLGWGSSPQGRLRISRDNGAVRMEIVIGRDQAFAFALVDKSHLGSKFVNQGLHYEMETVPAYSPMARLLRYLGEKVEPDDVGIGRRLVVTAPPEIARDGLLIVGFDPRNMSSFSNDLTK
ncbi:MAG: hypothetical protein ABSC21_09975 [Terriglobia bacterium]|jgi:hypothetical protein